MTQVLVLELADPVSEDQPHVHPEGLWLGASAPPTCDLTWHSGALPSPRVVGGTVVLGSAHGPKLLDLLGVS